MTSSQDYWVKRMDEIFAYVDQTDIDFFDKLQTIYTEGRQNIQKEIYSFYAQYAKENQISLQEAKKRLMREDLSDYRANAEKYFKQAKDSKDEELLKRLNEQYKAGKVTRLEALELDMTYQLGKLSNELHKSFSSYLKEAAKYAYRKVNFGNSASTLNKPALNQLIKTPFNGKNYSQSIWGNVDDLAADLKSILTKGLVRGMGPADMARELRKKYNVAKGRAEAIVRTDGTNIINNATVKRYQEAGLTEYEYLAHIDNRTTEICKSLNGKMFKIKDYKPGTNAPPMHVNCRSTIVPTDNEIGTDKNWKQKADDVHEKRNKVKSDKLDYKNYGRILKNGLPSFEKFQEMKYNGGSDWEQLKDNYFVKSRLNDGRYGATINPDKQAPHIKSTVVEGKSYFNDDVNIQALFDKYAGTGIVEKQKDGMTPKNTELINADDFKGIAVNLEGQYETNSFKIHHSKNRTHIVPIREET